MSNIVHVQVKQVGDSASEGRARDHRIVMDRPAAKGGSDLGAMGGEALLMALGGCFMSNLLAAVSARGGGVGGIRLDIGGKLAEAPARFSAVEMTVRAEFDDREKMEKLIAIAERGCIVANTLREAVQLTIRLDA